MYRGVQKVQANDNHTLLIEFDNGEVRLFDAKPLLGFGKFHALSELAEFKKAKVSFDTVEWENGLDLDPEYLYERSEPLTPPGAGPPEPSGVGPLDASAMP